MAVESKDRIIFLDVMRAFAVFMMVQGHTVHALLSTEYRTNDYVLYSVWHFLRGFTAPIFMFTAGVVFTYLFKLKGKSFKENPRVRKGIKRFFLLLALGYLLRYPTWRIIDFSIVTEREWLTFFVVDALHLIAFGILGLIFLLYLQEKTKINFYLLFAAIVSAIVFSSPFINSVEWKNILPLPLANYLTNAYGSFFPLFPWVAYVIAGGILGYFIALNPTAHRNPNFGFALLFFGAGVALLSFSLNGLFGTAALEKDIVLRFFFRLGVVVGLNGAVALSVIKIKNVPEKVKVMGRNTLFIYVVHLIVLYGSAWNPGLTTILGQKLSFELTLFSVVAMFVFVFGMINLRKKLKKIRIEKLLFSEV